ncbi:hypothetical protein ACL03H_16555 [Saccharopolyspora sp. MS10]|uniref:hypothetical protein n=1 Tax=Saccharopolyspora sp. MS10 TaxID=3385973 RepID=UPI0039A1D90C
MTAPARAKAASRTGSGEKKRSAKSQTSAKAPSKSQSKAQPKSKAQSKAATTTRAKKSAGTKGRSRSAAAERAYARREERRDRTTREPAERRPRRQRQAAEQRQWRLAAVRPRARQLQAKVATSRVPMVVAVMGLLAIGLVATLSLSIAAVGGSYRLQEVEQEVTALNEHREGLLREVSNLDSTPALQRKAIELGMVPPPGPPAHLVVQPDGSVRVIGEPEQASTPIPAAPPVQPPVDPWPPAPQPPAAPDPGAQRQAGVVPAVEGD